ncbi:nitroreductase/dihydropteridine reductase [Wenyingzhuangia heitensis]|uniref:Nitroreductase/dihydropteridine reductase n=1 Tax=Wenyingzhuangia heitensis TaxID=1487859 RepID=A0ABX0UCY8_9FLAO|nr:nitroreductase family protein [Wenyingzhuangia heitensis]NIJ45685.1 nitroreductase/dihydropteridine reductase [Wenyingzhuangia heitensis]
MKFLNAIQNRYTTKLYKDDKKIDTDKIEALKEVLRLSPSSINSQPWEFVFVSDVDTKNKLSMVSQHNTDKVKNCDTVVVFRSVDNLSKFKEELANRLPEYAFGFYQDYINQHSENETKTWMDKQLYIALGTFLSACATMQIDSTPMEGIEAEKYDAILGNDDYRSVFAVAIGFRDENDLNQLSEKPKSRKPLEEVIRTI